MLTIRWLTSAGFAAEGAGSISVPQNGHSALFESALLPQTEQIVMAADPVIPPVAGINGGEPK
jgi:hypothetical protein